jgi:uncharacterized protein (DUF1697 family)
VSGYAAFLRGINLGQRRRVSSGQLRSLFGGLGLREVATFRTSGNVVFDAGRESAARLAERIESELAAALGFEVTVFLRTAAEMRALADHDPFARRLIEGSKGKLQVALLSRLPTAAVRKDLVALSSAEDRLAFGKRELYWLPSGGTRDSALNMKRIEGLVGPMTMRTKGTIEELAAKYFARRG